MRPEYIYVSYDFIPLGQLIRCHHHPKFVMWMLLLNETYQFVAVEVTR